MKVKLAEALLRRIDKAREGAGIGTAAQARPAE